VRPPVRERHREDIRVNDRARLRILVLRVLVLSLFVTLGARLWYLQVMEGSQYRKVAETNRVREVVTPATRGLIVDDRGRALVRNRTSLTISVDRSVTDRQHDHGVAVLRRLSQVIKMPYPELHRRIQFCTATVGQPCWNGSPYQPIPVARDVTSQQALSVIEHQELFLGVSADLQAVRQYPYGTLSAHELGYLTPVTQTQLDKDGQKKGYHLNSLVGAAGLEDVYDQQLRGRDGVKRLQVDRFGRVSGTESQSPAQGGDHVVLSVDANVQRLTEEALAHTVDRARAAGKNPDSASAVVLNPKTGQVIAMASLPTYNPALFTGGITAAEYKSLTNPANGTPLISRAFQGSSAPGSTFKPVSLSTAVTSLGQPLDGTYACPASLQVGNQNFHNFDGESVGGAISLHQAIVISCDVIFDKFAYNAWQADGGLRAGRGSGPAAREAFVKMARAFGFGRQTGVDLPGETSGAVVDRAGARKQWQQLKTTYCNRAKNGYPEVKDPATAHRYQQYAQEACTDGFLYNGGSATQFAIGQGQYLSVSPLQLAVAYAAIANGGTVYEPRLASAVIGPDGKVVQRIKAPVAGRLPVSQETLGYLRDALHGVTTEGGGTAAGVFADWPSDRIPVAGKTGTAEVEGQGDTSWFASFAPADNPQYVVVVTIPRTGQGAQYAAPTAKEIYQGIYGIGRPAALAGGKVPTALPRVNKDGTISPPGSAAARTTSAHTSGSSASVLPAGLADSASVGTAVTAVTGQALVPVLLAAQPPPAPPVGLPPAVAAEPAPASPTGAGPSDAATCTVSGAAAAGLMVGDLIAAPPHSGVASCVGRGTGGARAPPLDQRQTREHARRPCLTRRPPPEPDAAA
jgi:penicillin-binding protein 2